MTDEMHKYYQILGLKTEASEKEIVEAYKVLVKVWQPDRFSNDPHVQKIATEKIKEIDEAFKQLLIWIGSPPEKGKKIQEPKFGVTTEPLGTPIPSLQEPLYEPSSKPLPRDDLKCNTEQVVVSPDVSQTPFSREYAFKKDPAALTNFLRIMLWIYLGIIIVLLLSDFIQMNFLSSASFLQTEAEANDLRQRIIEVLYLATFIVTGIAFLKWIHRANSNCHGFGTRNMKFSPGWSVGYYFIPIQNLYRPYRAMKEIWKVSKNPADWQNEPGSPLLGWWWALWIISGVLEQMSFSKLLVDNTLSSLKASTVISIVSAVVQIPLCIVGVSLVSAIFLRQKRLTERKAYENNTKKKQKLDLERESHHDSEPPPKWEKEQFSTTENRSYGESEPTSNELPLAAAVCVIFICLMIAVVVVVKSGDVQPQASSSLNPSPTSPSVPQAPSSSVETLSSNPPPQTAEFYNNRGLNYYKEYQPDKAIKDFSKAIAIDPKNLDAYFYRGRVYKETGKYENAINDFNQAISINPNDKKAYDNRGYVYLDLGKYKSAIDDFERAIQLDEKYLDAHIGLSIVFFRQKRLEQAKMYYQKAIDIEPLSKKGADALEWEKGCFYTLGQKQTIKEILNLF